MATSDQDRAQQIIERRTRSHGWMKDNFWPEWEEVFKSYKCVRDPELDPDGAVDPDQTSIGLPMTWSHIRRSTARATAQIPNLKFRSKDTTTGELISRTLMYQWDKGGIQRGQKRHFTQANLCGISIRAWYWSVDEYVRTKRVDPMDPKIDEATLMQISEMYGVPVKYLAHPEVGHVLRARMVEKFGRGKLLPIRYPYIAYEGPRCDFLFIGDCYFEPNFQGLQSSNWFIVERRRDRTWIDQVVKRYPEMARGFQELLTQFPNGSPHSIVSRDVQGLRERMMAAIGHKDDLQAENDPTREWTITEQHEPGADPKLTFIGENNVWLGQIPYPYDLDGRIAFTELVLVDDLLTGIGDSTARIIRGLQQLHDRQVNTRMGLVYNLLRPLIGTTNRELLENPALIKRYGGFRMVQMRGPGDMWVQGEQAAMASAAAGLQDESAVMRLYQMATGDSNMSMNANVDPQQARTATGARLMAYNQDVLTKDLVDMYNEAIKADAEMMYLLNRSELADVVEFDASRYNRSYAADADVLKEQWVKAEPIHFQGDGEIGAEVGSTLADDDEAHVTKATNLFSAAMSRPDLFNQQKARDEFLIAMGKGRELQQWAAPPPPPPPPSEIKASMSVAAKWEFLSEQERQILLQKAGIVPEPEASGLSLGAGPGGMGPAIAQGGPDPSQMDLGAQALQSAQSINGSPFATADPQGMAGPPQ